MIDLYAYVVIACLTIAAPGPGVVLSISNSLKYGLRGSVPGIFGLTCGMFVISLVSATSIGAVLSSSPALYSAAKIFGALYLLYLGIKMIRSKSIIDRSVNNADLHKHYNISNRFREGLVITFSNPKPILFFIAFFPQFINLNYSYIYQFIILSSIFCVLTLAIHFIYAYFRMRSEEKSSLREDLRL